MARAPQRVAWLRALKMPPMNDFVVDSVPENGYSVSWANKFMAECSDGGIGRRSGLKIHRPYGCASSTLAPSTIYAGFASTSLNYLG